MKTDYEKQASNFLMHTGTGFKAEFIEHGKHFQNDKDTRDIYKITLKRGSREYSFNFGQSIANSGKYHLAEHLRNKIISESLRKKYGSNYAFKKNDLKFDHSLREGKDWYKNENYSAPTAYDVLAALTKYDPGTFENFCGDYGYDTDSKSAEKTYKGVKEEFAMVQALWTDAEIEQLHEIQ